MYSTLRKVFNLKSLQNRLHIILTESWPIKIYIQTHLCTGFPVKIETCIFFLWPNVDFFCFIYFLEIQKLFKLKLISSFNVFLAVGVFLSIFRFWSKERIIKWMTSHYLLHAVVVRLDLFLNEIKMYFWRFLCFLFIRTLLLPHCSRRTKQNSLDAYWTNAAHSG